MDEVRGTGYETVQFLGRDRGDHDALRWLRERTRSSGTVLDGVGRAPCQPPFPAVRAEAVGEAGNSSLTGYENIRRDPQGAGVS